LKKSGLSRGVDSLTLILKEMEILEEFKKIVDIRKFGLFSQTVDDLLDFNGDKKRGEENFLLQEGYEKYLATFLEFEYKTLKKKFKCTAVFNFYYTLALRRAKKMVKLSK
jgi:geranylgeranyl pyrophosphate synthase